VLLVTVVTLCVPLFSSLTAPVTTIKSPTLVFAKVDAPAVSVPLDAKDKVTLVLLVLNSDVKCAVVYVPKLLKASGSVNLKVFTGPFKSSKKDCQFKATSLRIGGNETSAVQYTPSNSCVLVLPVKGDTVVPTVLTSEKLLVTKLGVVGMVINLATL
jgi:hypothetical protein